MSLLQKIQQNLQAAAAPAGVSGITEESRRLMQAKSGKAVGPSQSAVSNQAELAGLSELNAQLDQQRGAGQMQALQLQEDQDRLEQGEKLARSGMDLQQRATQQQFAQQEATQLQRAGQARSELDFDRQKSQAEQRSHTRAFENKQYLDTLNREGMRRRLDSELQMKKALSKMALGNSEELLRRALGNRELLTLDANEFKKLLAKIDINTARELANNAISDAKTQAAYGAAGGLASAAISGYGEYDRNQAANARANQPTTANTAPTAGVGGQSPSGVIK